jgi:hypothetical protein
MVEVCVSQENVANLVQIIERKVTNTGTGIKQYIVIDEHCGSAGTGTDSTAAAQDSYSHILATS